MELINPVFRHPHHHHHYRHYSSITPNHLSSSLLFLHRKPTFNSPQKHIFSPISCSSSTSPSPEVGSETAESCVNLGLTLFSKGRVKDALMQFETALTLNPNPIEAQAALYNKACCHAYRGEGKKAADCLRTALKEYNLKFATILNDPDLASFRVTPEFKELQEEARLGGEDIGYGFRRDLKLISEVQAPFRGVRKFFYVAFTAAAGISLFFTIPRLFLALQGGEGAPDVLATAQNFAINVGGIVVFVALYIWDNKKEEEQLAQISRNETLSRLPLRLSTNRVVELVQLRDTARPVILAGKKETVSLAMQKAERFRTDLLSRGVILVPVIWGEKDSLIAKRGFGGPKKAASSLPSVGEDFETRAQSITEKTKLKSEIRFKAEVVSPGEWERWIKEQQKSEGVTPGEDVYIILRLDGRVRRSGRGLPDWNQILKELPPMEALLSKLER
ncbi:putative tetratricopeptide-like helical domain superfamily, acetyltransferase A, auxiliary subunit [Helianthus annuus]|uniref:Putative tetratricopeptide repeat (TPR)-containing protein n=1 Tax=Helianthus annuus TaxID=4232 RepID=A0A251S523_HELAN|nr:protein LOW PSII ACCUMULATION 1, chloroplastic [Helianthus annuus]KAF5762865.1 putative tetratricopeptide-like helical domain superfamily, acetyltransferase A, auxiliary subunit [Helianthus annuus]